MVLVSDGFFVPGSGAPREVGRFFAMTMSLPLELQMVLSHRAFGSGRDVVKYTSSELAFRWAAKQ